MYIINSEGIAYHQHEVLYIIKPQERYTLARDEIQGRLADLDDIHDYVVMICQACGLDKTKSTAIAVLLFWCRHSKWNRPKT